MKHLLLTIQDEAKAGPLIRFLHTLDFLRLQPVDEATAAAWLKAEEEAFFAMAGIWADRPVAELDLRQAAWSRDQPDEGEEE